MKLKQEWKDVEKTTKQLERLFRKWYISNVDIIRGDGKTIEDVFGFPYTSSSEFAAIWNCQADARYRWDREWRFEGLAVSEDNDAVAYFSNEMKDMFVIIGKVN